MKQLVDLGAEHAVNVLHTTTGFPNAAVVSRAADALQIPWVYEFRGRPELTWLSGNYGRNESEVRRYVVTWRNAEVAYARAADAVVVLTELEKRCLVTEGVQEERITLVPNAVDQSLAGKRIPTAEAQRRCGLYPGRYIGTATALVGYEGLETAIAALRELPPDVRLLLVGEGIARPQLEALARMVGVGDRVVFAGRRPHTEMPQWYSCLSAFVVPRKDIPVCRMVPPVKPLEAIALGVPVIASDLPALREATGGHAKFFEPGNAEDLAEAVADVLAGETVSAPTEWILEHSWQANARRYSGIYQGLSGE